MTDSNAEALAALRAKLQQRFALDAHAAKLSEVRTSTNPGHYGDTVLDDGMKYASAFQDLDMAKPFFEGSRLAFDMALQRPEKPRDTIYETLSQRATVHFGRFLSNELFLRNEAPSDTTHFEVARAALQQRYTEEIFRDAERKPKSFRTAEFSTILVRALALTVTADIWGLPVDRDWVGRVAALPIAASFEGLRRPLVEILQGTADQEAAYEEYRQKYRARIHPGRYELGLIGDMRFSDAYVLSLAKERGQIATAALRMLI